MFKCLLIKPCSISHLSYLDPDYIKNILNFAEEIEINNDDFQNSISKFLEFDKFNNKVIDIKNNIFEEFKNNIFEIMFVTGFHDKDTDENNINKEHEAICDNDYDKINELAMLINSSSDDQVIKGSVLILKEHISSFTNNVSFEDLLKSDLEMLLINRKNNLVVIWDDMSMKWREDRINGFNNYIKEFFDDETPEVKHIEFLMHNIHIYYTYSTYGNKYICGRLLNDIPIDKCLFVTNKSSEYLGNITLDEVTKMIKISEKLDKYTVPGEFLEDDITINNRTIKNTKYKILDKVYNKYY